MRGGSNRLRRAVGVVCATVLLGGLAFVSPSTGLVPTLVYRNTGDSMPKGYYVYVPGGKIEPGAVVVVRDPPGFHLSWLMKEVKAVGGARYCWRPDLGTHTLNGGSMPPPLPAARQLGVPVWDGCRTIDRDEVVLYGQSAESFDSRYLGPIRISTLWGVYRLVF